MAQNIEEKSDESSTSRGGAGSGSKLSNADIKSINASRYNVESYVFQSNLQKYEMRETPQHKLSLQFNERNLVKMIDLPN